MSELKKFTIETEIESCFSQVVDSKFHWVTMKDLYRCVKSRVGKLSIKQFQNIIYKMWKTGPWESRKIELSKASIVRPHVSRYGIFTINGVYYYVKLRSQSK